MCIRLCSALLCSSYIIISCRRDELLIHPQTSTAAPLKFGDGQVIHPFLQIQVTCSTLRWRRNGHDGVSIHQPHECSLNHLFGCRSNKISKLRVTGLCAGNSPGTGEFPAQMASNAETVSIWWRHHEPYPYPEPVVFQWPFSGNPVCLELRPQCTLGCHWRKNCW